MTKGMGGDRARKWHAQGFSPGPVAWSGGPHTPGLLIPCPISGPGGLL